MYFSVYSTGDGYRIEGMRSDGKRISTVLDSSMYEAVSRLASVLDTYVDADVAEVIEQLATWQERYHAVIETFAEWRTGLSVKAGERYRYDGELYEVIQDHKTQASWAPDSAKSLFKSVTGGLEDEDGEIILDFVQPTGAHDTYQKGDKVRYNNVIYESLMNNNSWSPDAYAQAWKAIEEN